VAGATTMAFRHPRPRRAGARCLLRTGDPVSPSISAASKNASADGVAITWTVQPRANRLLDQRPHVRGRRSAGHDNREHPVLSRHKDEHRNGVGE